MNKVWQCSTIGGELVAPWMMSCQCQRPAGGIACSESECPEIKYVKRQGDICLGAKEENKGHSRPTESNVVDSRSMIDPGEVHNDTQMDRGRFLQDDKGIGWALVSHGDLLYLPRCNS